MKYEQKKEKKIITKYIRERDNSIINLIIIELRRIVNKSLGT